MKQIKESELILNPDGSIYHLNLRPEHLANNVIFVGDQDRVEEITKYFDSLNIFILVFKFILFGIFFQLYFLVQSSGIATQFFSLLPLL